MGEDLRHDGPHRKRFELFGEADGRGRRDSTAKIGGRPEHRDCPDGYDGVPPRIHRSAVINSDVTVDAGMTVATSVGARTFLMTKCHVGHDAMIGDDVDLAPMANIGGHAIIGDGAKIGMSAVVVPYRIVGAKARVGAGAVVTKDVPPGATVAGNPAKILDPGRRDPRLFSERGSGCRCYDEGHDPRVPGPIGDLACPCRRDHQLLLDALGTPLGAEA